MKRKKIFQKLLKKLKSIKTAVMQKKYNSIALVRWELPFPLVLPQRGFFCWEPIEGVAAIDPEGEIGSLHWKRKCTFFEPKLVFQENRKLQDPRHWPTCNYRIENKLKTGESVITAELFGGPEGGFKEARPYTVANIFLCLTRKYSYKDEATRKRAHVALNNLLETYRFLTLDPFLRPIHDEDDHYCTTFSEAKVPKNLQSLPPERLLEHISDLTFGSNIGKDRMHRVGTNSYDDLAGKPLSQAGIELLHKHTREEHRLELFHQLIFSSVRRLKRKEGVLAIIDAQTAFETAVVSMLKDALAVLGWDQNQINQELEFGGELHLLNKRLKKLDDIADEKKTTYGYRFAPFLGSPFEAEWRDFLYDVRHKIVHGGLRQISFEDAKHGVVAGLKAINFLHSMCPLFEREFMWAGQSLELPHIQNTSGRIFRLFET
jgi:hypothetical protein